MNRITRLLVVNAVLATTVNACRQPEVRPEELFQAQSRGLSSLETGELPEAETQFRKVTALAPNDPLGHANLGLTYLRGARYADAEKELQRARELAPADPDVGLMVAKLYAVTGRVADARSTLDQLRRAAPRNPHILYAIAELYAAHAAGDSTPRDAAADRQYEQAIREVVAVAPSNLAVRLELIDAMVRLGQPDSAVRHLEEVRRVGPDIPPEARGQLEQSIQLLRAGKLAEARRPLDRFLQLMEVTSTYQAALTDVKWLEGPLSGRPVLSFTPKSLVMLRASSSRGSAADVVRFVDATADAGLPDVPAPEGSAMSGVLAVGDYDGDGTDDLFTQSWSIQQAKAITHLYHVRGLQLEDVTQRAGITLPTSAIFATFADVDNDGRLDLFVLGADHRPYLFHNTGSGTFTDVTAKSGITNVAGARKALFVDLDHDGDLDLVLTGGPTPIVYRNNLDGTFTDVSAAMGFTAGPGGATNDATFADFDDDGRIDLLVDRDAGSASLYHNEGNRRFTDVITASGITANGGPIAIGDYNNDGYFDVMVAGAGGRAPTLWLNDGTGKFHGDTRSAAALKALRAISIADASFVDYDNDGWLDLVVAGTPAAPGGRGVMLLHNDGKGAFVDRSSLLPLVGAATAIAANDVDGDGDQDLLVATSRGVRLLRNDGANGNLSMQVKLIGLRTGSGKNNDFGVGAKVTVRAADLLQTRVVTSRVTQFGLGPHLKADVVRIEWPNGVPQTVFFPGSDQDVIENEVLKGSCAFLYAWNGHGFRFVTDVMWRSALGMPLGILGSNTAFAPAGASTEYLRIPGNMLQARDGKYTLQLTEELWETAYADQIKLVAVDHPDSVNIFVDERFVPPGPVQLRLFHATHEEAPRSAVDDRGNDVLPALLAADSVYVSNLTPLQFQGLVEPHDLIMDLGPNAGGASPFLFLRGWIYPTDASINVALSQQSTLKTMMPSLEVRDGRGRWITAIANIGFPSGKDKTMVIDLGGKFPTADHHVRIRTNLQIYWDQAFIARDAERAETNVTPLGLSSADLHFRGYSRTYRKGGRYGPWWFDYDSVTRESPWRPIEGAFTRFGDIASLLTSSDDMYAIMAPGDEATLQFDASSANRLPAGWTRDFLLYTDGWIKDSDLNTAFGTTVEPLPFHRIREYPYAAGDAYPTDPSHQQYRREFNTRVVARHP